MRPGVAKSLKLVFLILLVSCAGRAGYGLLSGGDRLVGSIDSGAEGLEIVLPNSGSCCGEAMTELGGSPAKIYLASEPTGGANMLVYLGRDDRTILMESSGGDGHYDRELFRSEPGLRTPDGELTMRIPPGVLPAGTLRLWSGGLPARTAVTGILLQTP